MPLENFGSILNFAEELENQDRRFYAQAAANPACSAYRDLFEQFGTEAQKNIQTIRRTRRENVTEMILEPIRDFTRAPFCESCEAAESMPAAEALATARRLEERAARYFSQASEKIKAQPEVSRALKLLAKKHNARLQKLEELSA